MNSGLKNKVLMIGMDSADQDYLLTHLPFLPHLKKLFADGRLLKLNTTAADMDASVWPTFYTGKLPGEHGTYFPFQWDHRSMCYKRINKLDWLDYEPFWNRLGARGIPVGLMDIMMVPVPPAPAPNVNQYFWHTQDEGAVERFNRSVIWPEVKRRFGLNKLGYDISADMSGGQRADLSRRLLESTRTRGKITRWILDHTDWGLFITSFSEIHRAGHYFYPDPEDKHNKTDKNALLECYKETDNAIGHILAGIDHEHTHVVVFSLSGMGPNNSQSHFLTEVLDRFNRQYAGEGATVLTNLQKPGLIHTLRNVLPGPLQVEIGRRVSQGVRDWVVNRAFTGGMDWDSTLAFHVLSGGQGYIRWNISGRERAGILTAESPELIRYSKALKDELLSLTDIGSGRKIVKRLVDIPGVYPGPYAKHLPDISVLWEDMAPVTGIISPRLGEFKGRIGTGRGGNHRDMAFALTSSPVSGDQPDPVHIVDLARYVETLLTATPVQASG
jgi:predicted AlkP superfamily phosphohydrolase/phosphomutase